MPPICLQAARTNASPEKPETASSTRGVIEELLEELRQSRAYTLESAMAMPEDKYSFRPVPEVRSFGQQLVHIAEANGSIMEWHVEAKKNPSWPYSGGGERVTSKADVIAQLNASYDYIERGLSYMTDATLRDRVKAEDGEEFSRQWGLHLILDHATHHRGQVVVYLRMNGIKPPEYRV